MCLAPEVAVKVKDIYIYMHIYVSGFHSFALNYKKKLKFA
jgi:hypothetical protein